MSDADDLLQSRVKTLKSSSTQGKCVLYIMSRDQRVADNHALLAAQKHAISKKLPLAVVFCLQNKTGNRAREHYEFMMSGLFELESTLHKFDIPFMLLIGDPKQKIAAVIHHTSPDAVYFDFNPLRGPRALQTHIAKNATCNVYVVDTHNIVPVWVASDKQEYAAYTMRPKLHRLLNKYLIEPDKVVVHPYVWPGTVRPTVDLKDLIEETLQKQQSNGTKISWHAGEQAANLHLDAFINKKIEVYGTNRNSPLIDAQSNLSPYLHFGHISSLRVALNLQKESLKIGNNLHLLNSSTMPKQNDQSNKQYSIDALLEELIVRKELADNFCYYCPDYDNLHAAQAWALQTLTKHRLDERKYLYSYSQLESATTHDKAWNTAQTQLTTVGKMHGYMRMYWAKKVLEWTESPEQAIEFLVKLNDFYSIDGGDPNGYAGILWSVAGVHDRPWNERSIFGLIRYMNYDGLKRKFDLKAYEKS